MANKFRLFTKRFLVLLNFGVVFIFLMACLAPYLDPQNWWFISFLGLGFPFLLLGVIGFLGWWLFVKRKYALISAIALLLGFKSISVFFAFHVPRNFIAEISGKLIFRGNFSEISMKNRFRFLQPKLGMECSHGKHRSGAICGIPECGR